MASDIQGSIGISGDTDFQRAYEAARARYTRDEWMVVLDPRRRTEAIYRELRHLDAERVRSVHCGEGERAIRPIMNTESGDYGVG